MKKIRLRVYGFLCCTGLWNPQMQLQITPLCWGLGVAITHRKIAIQIGPIAAALWYSFRGWKATCALLND